MKRWIIVLLVLLLGVGAYVVAGPYLTYRSIVKAVETQDADALARQIDFPALRESVTLQLTDRLVRQAGPDVQANAFGAIGLSVGANLIAGSVDTMLTPTGIAALMEGRKVWNKVGSGLTFPDMSGRRTAAVAAGAVDPAAADSGVASAPAMDEAPTGAIAPAAVIAPAPAAPTAVNAPVTNPGLRARANDALAARLQGARLRYESTSRFTATMDDAEGRPMTVVMTRDGLQWRVSDVRLPLD